MIVEMDFLDHWKTQALIGLLDDDCAPLYMLRIWAHCQSRKTQRLPLGSLNKVSIAVAAIAKYPVRTKKTAEEFFNALVETGFIDIEKTETDENMIQPVAHDWEKSNCSLVASWENGTRGGRPKKNNPAVSGGITQRKPSGNPASENQNPVETDREEKIEKRRERENAPSSFLETVQTIKDLRPEFSGLNGDDVARILHNAQGNPRYQTNIEEFCADAANSLEPIPRPTNMLRAYLNRAERQTGPQRPAEAEYVPSSRKRPVIL